MSVTKRNKPRKTQKTTKSARRSSSRSPKRAARASRSARAEKPVEPPLPPSPVAEPTVVVPLPPPAPAPDPAPTSAPPPIEPPPTTVPDSILTAVHAALAPYNYRTLALKVGCHWTHIGFMLRGRRRASSNMLARLSDVLSIPMRDLHLYLVDLQTRRAAMEAEYKRRLEHHPVVASAVVD